MSSSTLKLPTDLYSPDQLSAIVMELRNTIGDQRDALLRARGKQMPPEILQTSALLAGVMHNAKVSVHDVGACEELLGRLEALRAASPVAHIMLADVPNRTIKRQLTEWFREQIHPGVLLTFAARADIGGGIVVQVGSHLYDFSFRKQIMQHRKRIGQLFAAAGPVVATPVAGGADVRK